VSKSNIYCFFSWKKVPEGGAPEMWTVVYIAPNRATADMLKNYLMTEGLLVMLRSIGVPHLGDSGSVEILVPESEVEEAHEILSYALGK
jgi:hypothetical protein